MYIPVQAVEIRYFDARIKAELPALLISQNERAATIKPAHQETLIVIAPYQIT